MLKALPAEFGEDGGLVALLLGAPGGPCLVCATSGQQIIALWLQQAHDLVDLRDLEQ